jgi:hypothetical protein
MGVLDFFSLRYGAVAVGVMRTWTGVRVYDCYAFLACAILEEAFLGAVVSCASESGEVENHGDFM